jgi:hypothetical protein
MKVNEILNEVGIRRGFISQAGRAGLGNIARGNIGQGLKNIVGGVATGLGGIATGGLSLLDRIGGGTGDVGTVRQRAERNLIRQKRERDRSKGQQLKVSMEEIKDRLHRTGINIYNVKDPQEAAAGNVIVSYILEKFAKGEGTFPPNLERFIADRIEDELSNEIRIPSKIDFYTVRDLVTRAMSIRNQEIDRAVREYDRFKSIRGLQTAPLTQNIQPSQQTATSNLTPQAKIRQNQIARAKQTRTNQAPQAQTAITPSSLPVQSQTQQASIPSWLDPKLQIPTVKRKARTP